MEEPGGHSSLHLLLRLPARVCRRPRATAPPPALIFPRDLGLLPATRLLATPGRPGLLRAASPQPRVPSDEALTLRGGLNRGRFRARAEGLGTSAAWPRRAARPRGLLHAGFGMGGAEQMGWEGAAARG